MRDVFLEIVTSYYTWIAIEMIAIAVLVFFVAKNSRRKKEITEEMNKLTVAHQYRELDEMLINKKRGER